MNKHYKHLDQYSISLSQAAMAQILLIKENDYTIDQHHLRISINGKECDGFRYAIGFSPVHPEDIVLSYPQDIKILLDPFVSQYFKSGIVDYQINEHEEGFVVTNDDELKYHGKFFAEDLKKGNIPI